MGILHSFDRLRLQGSLRYLYCVKIFEQYLSTAKVLYKDFKQFATGLTNEVCQGAEHQMPSAPYRAKCILPKLQRKGEDATQILNDASV